MKYGAVLKVLWKRLNDGSGGWRIVHLHLGEAIRMRSAECSAGEMGSGCGGSTS